MDVYFCRAAHQVYSAIMSVFRPAALQGTLTAVPTCQPHLLWLIVIRLEVYAEKPDLGLDVNRSSSAFVLLPALKKFNFWDSNKAITLNMSV